MAAKSLCKIDGCGKGAKARGWCSAHYKKFRKYGDPLAGDTRRWPYGSRRKWLDDHAGNTGDDCLIWPFAKPRDGYPLVTLPGGLQIGAHVYMCEKVHGARPSQDHEVAHSCGNGRKGCVHPEHLRWATGAENAADRLVHGTDGRGEKNGMAKLTRADVSQIIALRGIETGRALAESFGVTPAQISNIQLRKQWAYPD
jgi:hypothetical protein